MKPRAINQLEYTTGETIKMFSSVSEVEKLYNIDGTSIRYAIKNNNGRIVKKKLRFEYAEPLGVIRKVVQLDYITNEVIEVYNSVNQASIDNFISPCSIRIALAKNNGILHRKKLKFKYLD